VDGSLRLNRSLLSQLLRQSRQLSVAQEDFGVAQLLGIQEAHALVAERGDFRLGRD